MNWFSTYRVHHRVAHSFRTGRVFLLGDAAHVHSPVGGQGMNTGIGDAVNLAWKLAAVLGGGAAESCSTRYERERIGFARRLVATTDRIFTLVTAQGSVARLCPHQARPSARASAVSLARGARLVVPDRVADRRPVSQQPALRRARPDRSREAIACPGFKPRPTRITLHRSKSLAWQVHVYGEPRRETVDACRDLGLPIHSFAWVPEMKGTGFQRGALYLVRPDGYVALADTDGGPDRLRRYLATIGLTLGPEKRGD